ncbi:MAG: DeoR family transcriptional regulator [Parcubacteria group bacterium]|nr:DeoR family transcriptional regulator [Parcubacteria group bacterium]
MDSDFFMRLTFGLYRVTELLSGGSVLRSKIEESASRLLIHLIFLTRNQNPEEKNETIIRASAELQMLLGFLQSVKRLRVINDKNFVVLEREYAKVRRFLTRTSLQRAPSLRQTSSVSNPKELNSRQEKMLEILRYKEKVQVWELKKLLPEVTKRTLRRDLDDLLKRNLVIREGEWNDIFYRISAGTGVSVEKVLGIVGQR